jgi:hypothetical protein
MCITIPIAVASDNATETKKNKNLKKEIDHHNEEDR